MTRKSTMRRAPKPPPDWRDDPRLWEVHIDTYRHRRAIENAARKHGARLGESFLMLLMVQLTLVDVDRDGMSPSPMSAYRTIASWAREGRRGR